MPRPRRTPPPLDHSPTSIRLVQVRENAVTGPIVRYELERLAPDANGVLDWFTIPLVIRAE